MADNLPSSSTKTPTNPPQLEYLELPGLTTLEAQNLSSTPARHRPKYLNYLKYLLPLLFFAITGTGLLVATNLVQLPGIGELRRMADQYYREKPGATGGTAVGAKREAAQSQAVRGEPAARQSQTGVNVTGGQANQAAGGDDGGSQPAQGGTPVAAPAPVTPATSPGGSTCYGNWCRVGSGANTQGWVYIQNPTSTQVAQLDSLTNKDIVAIRTLQNANPYIASGGNLPESLGGVPEGVSNAPPPNYQNLIIAKDPTTGITTVTDPATGRSVTVKPDGTLSQSPPTSPTAPSTTGITGIGGSKQPLTQLFGFAFDGQCLANDFRCDKARNAWSDCVQGQGGDTFGCRERAEAAHSGACGSREEDCIKLDQFFAEHQDIWTYLKSGDELRQAFVSYQEAIGQTFDANQVNAFVNQASGQIKNLDQLSPQILQGFITQFVTGVSPQTATTAPAQVACPEGSSFNDSGSQGSGCYDSSGNLLKAVSRQVTAAGTPFTCPQGSSFNGEGADGGGCYDGSGNKTKTIDEIYKEIQRNIGYKGLVPGDPGCIVVRTGVPGGFCANPSGPGGYEQARLLGEKFGIDLSQRDPTCRSADGEHDCLPDEQGNQYYNATIINGQVMVSVPRDAVIGPRCVEDAGGGRCWAPANLSAINPSKLSSSEEFDLRRNIFPAARTYEQQVAEQTALYETLSTYLVETRPEQYDNQDQAQVYLDALDNKGRARLINEYNDYVAQKQAEAEDLFAQSLSQTRSISLESARDLIAAYKQEGTYEQQLNQFISQQQTELKEQLAQWLLDTHQARNLTHANTRVDSWNEAELQTQLDKYNQYVEEQQAAAQPILDFYAQQATTELNSFTPLERRLAVGNLSDSEYITQQSQRRFTEAISLSQIFSSLSPPTITQATDRVRTCLPGGPGEADTCYYAQANPTTVYRYTQTQYNQLLGLRDQLPPGFPLPSPTQIPVGEEKCTLLFGCRTTITGYDTVYDYSPSNYTQIAALLGRLDEFQDYGFYLEVQKSPQLAQQIAQLTNTQGVTTAPFTDFRNDILPRYEAGLDAFQQQLAQQAGVTDTDAMALIDQVNFTDPDYTESDTFRELNSNYPEIVAQITPFLADQTTRNELIVSSRDFAQTSTQLLPSQTLIPPMAIYAWNTTSPQAAVEAMCTKPDGSPRGGGFCGQAYDNGQVNLDAANSCTSFLNLGRCGSYQGLVNTQTHLDPLAASLDPTILTEGFKINYIRSQAETIAETRMTGETRLVSPANIGIATQVGTVGALGIGGAIAGLIAPVEIPVAVAAAIPVGIFLAAHPHKTWEALQVLTAAPSSQIYFPRQDWIIGTDANGDGNLIDANNWDRLRALLNYYTLEEVNNTRPFIAGVGGSRTTTFNQFSYENQYRLFSQDIARCGVSGGSASPDQITCMGTLGEASHLTIATDQNAKALNAGILASTIAAGGGLGVASRFIPTSPAINFLLYSPISALPRYTVSDVIIGGTAALGQAALTQTLEENRAQTLSDLAAQNPDSDYFSTLAQQAIRDRNAANAREIAMNFLIDFGFAGAAQGAAAGENWLAGAIGRALDLTPPVSVAGMSQAVELNRIASGIDTSAIQSTDSRLALAQNISSRLGVSEEVAKTAIGNLDPSLDQPLSDQLFNQILLSMSASPQGLRLTSFGGRNSGQEYLLQFNSDTNLFTLTRTGSPEPLITLTDPPTFRSRPGSVIELSFGKDSLAFNSIITPRAIFDAIPARTQLELAEGYRFMAELGDLPEAQRLPRLSQEIHNSGDSIEVTRLDLDGKVQTYTLFVEGDNLRVRQGNQVVSDAQVGLVCISPCRIEVTLPEQQPLVFTSAVTAEVARRADLVYRGQRGLFSNLFGTDTRTRVGDLTLDLGGQPQTVRTILAQAQEAPTVRAPLEGRPSDFGALPGSTLTEVGAPTQPIQVQPPAADGPAPRPAAEAVPPAAGGEVPTARAPPKSNWLTPSPEDVAISQHRPTTPPDPNQPTAIRVSRNPKTGVWSTSDFSLQGRTTPEQIQQFFVAKFAAGELTSGEVIAVDLPGRATLKWTVTETPDVVTLNRLITDPWSLTDGTSRPDNLINQAINFIRSQSSPVSYQSELAQLFDTNLQNGLYDIVDVGGRPVYTVKPDVDYSPQDVLAAKLVNQEVADQLAEVSGFTALRFIQVDSYSKVLAVLNQEGKVLLTLPTGGGKNTVAAPIAAKMATIKGQNAVQLVPDILLEENIALARTLRDFYDTDVFVARQILDINGQPTGARIFSDLDGNPVDSRAVAARLRESGQGERGAIIVTDYATASYARNDVIKLRLGQEVVGDLDFARAWQVAFDLETLATGDELGQVISGRWSSPLDKVTILELQSGSRLAYGLTPPEEQSLPDLLHSIFSDTDSFTAVVQARSGEVPLVRDVATGEMRALDPSQAAEIIRQILKTVSPRLEANPDFPNSFLALEIPNLLRETDPWALIARFDGLRQTLGIANLAPTDIALVEEFASLANAYNAAVYSRLDTRSKIPGNDFVLSDGTIKLASSKLLTGTEYTDVMQIWALQHEGRLMLGAEPPTQEVLLSLQVSDRSVITAIDDLIGEFKGGFVAMDATDGIPQAKLGLTPTYSTVGLHRPEAIAIGRTREEVLAQLSRDVLSEWGEGRQGLLVNQNALTESLDANSIRLVQGLTEDLEPGDRFAVALMSGDGKNTLRLIEVQTDASGTKTYSILDEVSHPDATSLYEAGKQLTNVRGILAISENRTRGLNYKPQSTPATDIGHVKIYDQYGNSIADNTRQAAGRKRDVAIPEYQLYWVIPEQDIYNRYSSLLGQDNCPACDAALTDIRQVQTDIESLLRFERQLANLRNETKPLIAALETTPQASQPQFRDFLSTARADITENDFAFKSTPLEEDRLSALYKEYRATRQRMLDLLAQAQKFGVAETTLANLRTTHLAEIELTLSQLEALAHGQDLSLPLPQNSLEARLAGYTLTDGESLLAATYNRGSAGDPVAIAQDIAAFQAGLTPLAARLDALDAALATIDQSPVGGALLDQYPLLRPLLAATRAALIFSTTGELAPDITDQVDEFTRLARSVDDPSSRRELAAQALHNLAPLLPDISRIVDQLATAISTKEALPPTEVAEAPAAAEVTTTTRPSRLDSIIATLKDEAQFDPSQIYNTLSSLIAEQRGNLSDQLASAPNPAAALELIATAVISARADDAGIEPAARDREAVNSAAIDIAQIILAKIDREKSPDHSQLVQNLVRSGLLSESLTQTLLAQVEPTVPVTLPGVGGGLPGEEEEPEAKAPAAAAPPAPPAKPPAPPTAPAPLPEEPTPPPRRTVFDFIRELIRPSWRRARRIASLASTIQAGTGKPGITFAPQVLLHTDVTLILDDTTADLVFPQTRTALELLDQLTDITRLRTANLTRAQEQVIIHTLNTTLLLATLIDEATTLTTQVAFELEDASGIPLDYPEVAPALATLRDTLRAQDQGFANIPADATQAEAIFASLALTPDHPLTFANLSFLRTPSQAYTYLTTLAQAAASLDHATQTYSHDLLLAVETRVRQDIADLLQSASTEEQVAARSPQIQAIITSWLTTLTEAGAVGKATLSQLERKWYGLSRILSEQRLTLIREGPSEEQTQLYVYLTNLDALTSQIDFLSTNLNQVLLLGVVDADILQTIAQPFTDYRLFSPDQTYDLVSAEIAAQDLSDDLAALTTIQIATSLNPADTQSLLLELRETNRLLANLIEDANPTAAENIYHQLAQEYALRQKLLSQLPQAALRQPVPILQTRLAEILFPPQTRDELTDLLTIDVPRLSLRLAPKEPSFTISPQVLELRDELRQQQARQLEARAAARAQRQSLALLQRGDLTAISPEALASLDTGISLRFTSDDLSLLLRTRQAVNLRTEQLAAIYLAPLAARSDEIAALARRATQETSPITTGGPEPSLEFAEAEPLIPVPLRSPQPGLPPSRLVTLSKARATLNTAQLIQANLDQAQAQLESVRSEYRSADLISRLIGQPIEVRSLSRIISQLQARLDEIPYSLTQLELILAAIDNPYQHVSLEITVDGQTRRFLVPGSLDDLSQANTITDVTSIDSLLKTLEKADEFIFPNGEVTVTASQQQFLFGTRTITYEFSDHTLVSARDITFPEIYLNITSIPRQVNQWAMNLVTRIADHLDQNLDLVESNPHRAVIEATHQVRASLSPQEQAELQAIDQAQALALALELIQDHVRRDQPEFTLTTSLTPSQITTIITAETLTPDQPGFLYRLRGLGPRTRTDVNSITITPLSLARSFIPATTESRLMEAFQQTYRDNVINANRLNRRALRQALRDAGLSGLPGYLPGFTTRAYQNAIIAGFRQLYLRQIGRDLPARSPVAIAVKDLIYLYLIAPFSPNLPGNLPSTGLAPLRTYSPLSTNNKFDPDQDPVLTLNLSNRRAAEAELRRRNVAAQIFVVDLAGEDDAFLYWNGDEFRVANIVDFRHTLAQLHLSLPSRGEVIKFEIVHPLSDKLPIFNRISPRRTFQYRLEQVGNRFRLYPESTRSSPLHLLRYPIIWWHYYAVSPQGIPARVTSWVAARFTAIGSWANAVLAPRIHLDPDLETATALQGLDGTVLIDFAAAGPDSKNFTSIRRTLGDENQIIVIVRPGEPPGFAFWNGKKRDFTPASVDQIRQELELLGTDPKDFSLRLRVFGRLPIPGQTVTYQWDNVYFYPTKMSLFFLNPSVWLKRIAIAPPTLTGRLIRAIFRLSSATSLADIATEAAITDAADAAAEVLDAVEEVAAEIEAAAAPVTAPLPPTTPRSALRARIPQPPPSNLFVHIAAALRKDRPFFSKNLYIGLFRFPVNFLFYRLNPLPYFFHTLFEAFPPFKAPTMADVYDATDPSVTPSFSVVRLRALNQLQQQRNSAGLPQLAGKFANHILRFGSTPTQAGTRFTLLTVATIAATLITLSLMGAVSLFPLFAFIAIPAIVLVEVLQILLFIFLPGSNLLRLGATPITAPPPDQALYLENVVVGRGYGTFGEADRLTPDKLQLTQIVLAAQEDGQAITYTLDSSGKTEQYTLRFISTADGALEPRIAIVDPESGAETRLTLEQILQQKGPGTLAIPDATTTINRLPDVATARRFLNSLDAGNLVSYTTRYGDVLIYQVTIDSATGERRLQPFTPPPAATTTTTTGEPGPTSPTPGGGPTPADTLPSTPTLPGAPTARVPAGIPTRPELNQVTLGTTTFARQSDSDVEISNPLAAQRVVTALGVDPSASDATYTVYDLTDPIRPNLETGPTPVSNIKLITRALERIDVRNQDRLIVFESGGQQIALLRQAENWVVYLPLPPPPTTTLTPPSPDKVTDWYSARQYALNQSPAIRQLFLNHLQGQPLTEANIRKAVPLVAKDIINFVSSLQGFDQNLKDQIQDGFNRARSAVFEQLINETQPPPASPLALIGPGLVTTTIPVIGPALATVYGTAGSVALIGKAVTSPTLLGRIAPDNFAYQNAVQTANRFFTNALHWLSFGFTPPAPGNPTMYQTLRRLPQFIPGMFGVVSQPQTRPQPTRTLSPDTIILQITTETDRNRARWDSLTSAAGASRAQEENSFTAAINQQLKTDVAAIQGWLDLAQLSGLSADPQIVAAANTYLQMLLTKYNPQNIDTATALSIAQGLYTQVTEHRKANINLITEVLEAQVTIDAPEDLVPILFQALANYYQNLSNHIQAVLTEHQQTRQNADPSYTNSLAPIVSEALQPPSPPSPQGLTPFASLTFADQSTSQKRTLTTPTQSYSFYTLDGSLTLGNPQTGDFSQQAVSIIPLVHLGEDVWLLLGEDARTDTPITTAELPIFIQALARQGNLVYESPQPPFPSQPQLILTSYSANVKGASRPVYGLAFNAQSPAPAPTNLLEDKARQLEALISQTNPTSNQQLFALPQYQAIISGLSSDQIQELHSRLSLGVGGGAVELPIATTPIPPLLDPSSIAQRFNISLSQAQTVISKAQQDLTFLAEQPDTESAQLYQNLIRTSLSLPEDTPIEFYHLITFHGRDIDRNPLTTLPPAVAETHNILTLSIVNADIPTGQKFTTFKVRQVGEPIVLNGQQVNDAIAIHFTPSNISFPGTVRERAEALEQILEDLPALIRYLDRLLDSGVSSDTIMAGKIHPDTAAALEAILGLTRDDTGSIPQSILLYTTLGQLHDRAQLYLNVHQARLNLSQARQTNQPPQIIAELRDELQAAKASLRAAIAEELPSESLSPFQADQPIRQPQIPIGATPAQSLTEFALALPIGIAVGGGLGFLIAGPIGAVVGSVIGVVGATLGLTLISPRPQLPETPPAVQQPTPVESDSTPPQPPQPTIPATTTQLTPPAPADFLDNYYQYAQEQSPIIDALFRHLYGTEFTREELAEANRQARNIINTAVEALNTDNWDDREIIEIAEKSLSAFSTDIWDKKIRAELSFRLHGIRSNHVNFLAYQLAQRSPLASSQLVTTSGIATDQDIGDLSTYAAEAGDKLESSDTSVGNIIEYHTQSAAVDDLIAASKQISDIQHQIIDLESSVTSGTLSPEDRGEMLLALEELRIKKINTIKLHQTLLQTDITRLFRIPEDPILVNKLGEVFILSDGIPTIGDTTLERGLSGSIASKTAVTEIPDTYYDESFEPAVADPIKRMTAVINHVQQNLALISESSSRASLNLVIINGRDIIQFSLGDPRYVIPHTYIIPKRIPIIGSISEITPLSEIKPFGYTYDPGTEPTITSESFEPGDWVIQVSEGINRLLTAKDIQKLVRQSRRQGKTPAQAAQTIIDKAHTKVQVNYVAKYPLAAQVIIPKTTSSQPTPTQPQSLLIRIRQAVTTFFRETIPTFLTHTLPQGFQNLFRPRPQLPETPPAVQQQPTQLAPKLNDQNLQGLIHADQTDPEELIRAFTDSNIILTTTDRTIAELYQGSAYVREKYSVGQHTRMVLTQFERYVAPNLSPQDRAFLRLIILTHDIGKSLTGGNRSLQHHYTLPIAAEIFTQLGLNIEQVEIARAVIDQDYIGGLLRYLQNSQGIGLTRTAYQITQTAQAVNLPPQDYYRLINALYMADASAYTVDAGGKKSLDDLFIFNRQNHTVAISNIKDGIFRENIESLENLISNPERFDWYTQLSQARTTGGKITLYKSIQNFDGQDVLPGGLAITTNRGGTTGVEYPPGTGDTRTDPEAILRHTLLGNTTRSGFSSWTPNPRIAIRGYGDKTSTLLAIEIDIDDPRLIDVAILLENDSQAGAYAPKPGTEFRQVWDRIFAQRITYYLENGYTEAEARAQAWETLSGNFRRIVNNTNETLVVGRISPQEYRIVSREEEALLLEQVLGRPLTPTETQVEPEPDIETILAPQEPPAEPILPTVVDEPQNPQPPQSLLSRLSSSLRSTLNVIFTFIQEYRGSPLSDFFYIFAPGLDRFILYSSGGLESLLYYILPSKPELEDTTIQTISDDLKPLIYVTTGIWSNTPETISQLATTMATDHFIIKQKYGLPPRDMRAISPLEYIRKLEEIAQTHRIPIRPASELPQFFEQYPSAAATYDEKLDTIFVPNVDTNDLQQLTEYAGNLEHELIQALQHQRYPGMPIEVQEYEANVAANLDLTQLSQNPAYIIDLFFGRNIFGSVNFWYNLPEHAGIQKPFWLITPSQPEEETSPETPSDDSLSFESRRRIPFAVPDDFRIRTPRDLFKSLFLGLDRAVFNLKSTQLRKDPYPYAQRISLFRPLTVTLPYRLLDAVQRLTETLAQETRFNPGQVSLTPNFTDVLWPITDPIPANVRTTLTQNPDVYPQVIARADHAAANPQESRWTSEQIAFWGFLRHQPPELWHILIVSRSDLGRIKPGDDIPLQFFRDINPSAAGAIGNLTTSIHPRAPALMAQILQDAYVPDSFKHFFSATPATPPIPNLLP